MKKLFNIIKLNPRKFISKDHLTNDKYRAISDFISGMTDRFAINLYNNFKLNIFELYLDKIKYNNS